jgi:hypothetical protein
MEMLKPILETVSAISLPVKFAWGGWLVWAVAQLGWYFWSRRGAPIYRTNDTASRSSAVRPAVARPKKPITAPAPATPYSSSDFITALEEEQQQVGGAGVLASEPSPYR